MSTAPATPITPERLMQFTFGFAPPLIIEAAIRHQVFNALDEGAKTVDTLSAETRTSPRGLRAILNALVGLELLAKDEDGRYALTPESATFLVSGKPAFHGAFFLLTSEPMLSEWRKLHEIVGSGHPAQHINREQDGVGFFSRFVEEIFPIHYPAAWRLAEALGVSKATAPLSVLDLAAGSGVWSVALAQQSPHVRVTAVDWAGVIPITRKVTARLGMADRFRFVEGDLLDADFGRGHTIATAGHILHSEGEQRSSDDLGDDVQRHLRPREAALRGIRQRDGRVEMRSRDRPEREDEGHQRGASGQRVGQQRQADAAAREPLAHDARANDRGQQQRCSHRLGSYSASQREM